MGYSESLAAYKNQGPTAQSEQHSVTLIELILVHFDAKAVRDFHHINGAV